MPQKPVSPRDFLAELSHRRVIRVALVYAVAAWAVVQVADTVLPRLNVPDWGVTLVIVLVALGFPIALALAWAFDLTPDGLQRTRADVTPAPAAVAAAPARGRAAGFLGVGILIGLVGVGAYARFGGKGAGPETGGERSIAVLPFVDMSSASDQEYFADGMTEELLNSLAGIDSLRVAARTSSFAFKGKNLPIREVAAQLGVRHVLEGSVRKEGSRLRITAQLIKADDGYHLWSDTYDRELSDVFAIQEEISRAIAAALRIELGLGEGETVVNSGTENTAAHDLYLKGRYHWNRRTSADLRRAAELMEQAVAVDPGYARAWAGLGAAYELIPNYDKSLPHAQYIGRARAALKRALDLDPRLGVAHSTLGDILLHFDWNFAESEREHLIALELAPNDATIHSWYAETLETTGRMDEALEHRRIALRLDPLDPKINVDYAGILLWLGRFDEALAQLDSTLVLDPDYLVAHSIRCLAGLAGRRFDLAETALTRYLELEGARADLVPAIFAGLREAPRRAAGLDALRAMERRGFSAELTAALYVAFDASDEALRVLEERVDSRDSEAPWIPTHPNYAPLRDDPRFRELVRRIGAEL